MMKIRNFVAYWLPLFAWMGLIFYLSSRPARSITEEYLVDFVIFKTLHMVEYALLYFLSFRAFCSLKKASVSHQKIYLYPFILAVLYAMSDEIHQTLVSSREGTVRDVIIDTIGIGLMYIYIKNHIGLVKKIL
jgi:VanZ family protein